VRLESKNSYTHGLFIASISHMPGSICGLWPAFWALGSGAWPNNGEIDILEGVNKLTTNQFTLHTSANCQMDKTTGLGALLSTDCAVGGGVGCAVTAKGSNTYGTPFNQHGGGVYAMQWTSSFIKIWFFPKGQVPHSIDIGKPTVSDFGTPQVSFAGSCDIDSHFKEHRLVFDTTFCGDWAGNIFADSGCTQSYAGNNMASCVDYVANNPSAFRQA
jgi:hypothetical protein